MVLVGQFGTLPVASKEDRAQSLLPSKSPPWYTPQSRPAFHPWELAGDVLNQKLRGWAWESIKVIFMRAKTWEMQP